MVNAGKYLLHISHHSKLSSGDPCNWLSGSAVSECPSIEILFRIALRPPLPNEYGGVENGRKRGGRQLVITPGVWVSLGIAPGVHLAAALDTAEINTISNVWLPCRIFDFSSPMFGIWLDNSLWFGKLRLHPFILLSVAAPNIMFTTNHNNGYTEGQLSKPSSSKTRIKQARCRNGSTQP